MPEFQQKFSMPQYMKRTEAIPVNTGQFVSDLFVSAVSI